MGQVIRTVVMFTSFHLSITLLLVAVTVGKAQQGDFLLFEKNRNHRAFYYPGDVISVRVKGSKSKVSGQIRALQDSIILFDYHRINLKDITHIYLDEKQKFWYGLRYKLEPLLLIGGAGYLVLDVVNTRAFDPGTLLISGSLITTGLLVRWLTRNDKTRIRGKRKLLILST